MANGSWIGDNSKNKPAQAIVDAAQKRQQVKANNQIRLRGASAGGVNVQPDKIVNLNTPKPNSNQIVLQGASEGGVNVQPNTVVDKPQPAPMAVENPARGQDGADGSWIGERKPGDGSWIGEMDQKPTPITPQQPTQQQIEPTQTTQQPAATTSQQQTVNGIDIEQLKASGLDEASIQRILNIVNPALNATQQAAQDNKQLLDYEMSLLDEQQKQFTSIYESHKQQADLLQNQEQELINYSAQVQANTLDQQKALETHLIEQERRNFELERSREERRIQEQNIKNEEETTMALASSLGLAFSSFGTQQIMKVRQDGENILADARAYTAIGNAEFTFRLQDIERNYGNQLNLIEQNRRDLSIKSLKDLYAEIKDIDSKLLLSSNEKREQAKESMQRFYQRKEQNDINTAKLISSVYEETYKKVDELKAQKAERETVNLELSEKLGYLANKYGEPVNTNADGSPRLISSDYDKDLSAQFGYLVDKKGNIIRDGKGNRVPYENEKIAEIRSLTKMLNNGELFGSAAAPLNGHIGTNNTISTTLQNGRRYKSSNPAWGDLQCGEYISTYFLAPGQTVGSYREEANDRIAKFGGKPGAFPPKVGDVVYMDYGYKVGGKEVPHKAIVEGIDENGDLILTDANLAGPGQVRHGWKVPVGSADYKKIFGFARLPLKTNVEATQPAFTASESTDGAAEGPNKMQKVIATMMLKEFGLSDGQIEDFFAKENGIDLDLDTRQKIIKDDTFQQTMAYKDYEVALQNYANVIKNIDDFQVLGENALILNNAWTDLAMGFRKANELGAIQEADMNLIKRMVGPAGVSNPENFYQVMLDNIRSGATGGPDGLRKSVDLQLLNTRNQMQDYYETTLGFYPEIKGTSLDDMLTKARRTISVEEFDVQNKTQSEQLQSVGVNTQVPADLAKNLTENAKDVFASLRSVFNGTYKEQVQPATQQVAETANNAVVTSQKFVITDVEATKKYLSDKRYPPEMIDKFIKQYNNQ